MASVKNDGEPQKPRRAPATTADGREQELFGLAYDLAEKQLRSGQASSQMITYLLKNGSETGRLERERLRREVQLLEARTQQIGSMEEIKKLHEDVKLAMITYNGDNEDYDYG